MFYIYHIPGVKIGCTQNLKRRVEYGQKCKNYEILEEHFDEDVASKRERELQKQYGYRVDSKEYNLARFRFLQKKGNEVTQKKYTKEDFGKWGKLGGNTNVESGHIHELGKLQGNKNVESGHLNEIRKMVDSVANGKKSGAKNIESGHIQQLGKTQGKINKENKFWENLTFEDRSRGGKKAAQLAIESGRLKELQKIITQKAAEKNRKKIVATNLNTLEVMIFDCAGHASQALNIESSYISKVCRGVYKKAKNYKFEYEKN